MTAGGGGDGRTVKVRVLTLSASMDGRSTLYRLEKGTVLQFRLGPSLLGRVVQLFVNHPGSAENGGKAFERETFRELKWLRDGGDDTAAYVDVPLVLAGSFKFYFTCAEDKKVNGSGFFLVDPVMEFGPTGHRRVLPLDGVQCQTVLAKNLGSFDTWEGKLKVAKESGYNMIHFTPVHVIGASMSAYSLADQHNLNVNFKTDWKSVAGFVDKMEKEWGVLSLCDIVLNHTSNETQW
jgi:glycogen debranching enzyme